MCDIKLVQNKLKITTVRNLLYVPDAFLGLFLTRYRGRTILLCGLLLYPLLYCRT